MDIIKIIEKNGQVVFGKILNFEGEIMDIILKSTDNFQAGDTLSCVFDEIPFSTTILKKYENHLFIYIPLFQKTLPNDRRKSPRIDVQFLGYLNDYRTEKVYKLPPEKKIDIIDMSINGFGFISNDQLEVDSPHFLYLKLYNNTIKSKIIIRNQRNYLNQFRYGTEIQAITRDDFEVLRRFLISIQLKNNLLGD